MTAIEDPSGALLVVRHGPGRGRLPDYQRHVLRRVAERAPALAAALRFHETGSGAAPDFSGVRAVVFWLGDPLRELYPACHAEAEAIAAEAEARGLALVNPPATLSNSSKVRQAALWQAAGLPTPAHTRFETRAELLAILEHHQGPLVLKGDQLHEQHGMHWCRSAAEAGALAPERIAYPGAVAEFVDTRAGWRARRPGSPFARYFHKKRAVVLGDAVHPRHIFFSRHPIVGQASSTYDPYRRLLPRVASLALRLAPWHRACIREDVAYGFGPPEQPELLRRAARALGFGWVALDYSSRADGGLVLWEANPYFHLPGAGGYNLNRERRFAPRFDGFCAEVEAFFTRLLV